MRLIDADDAKRIAGSHLTNPYEVISTMAVIDKATTIDPVHAAGGCYCRECKWYDDTGVCWWTSTDSTKNLRDADDFCSDGEPNMSDPPKEAEQNPAEDMRRTI